MVETVLIPLPERISFSRILSVVCEWHGLNRRDLVERNRIYRIAHPRQQVMWMMDRLRPDVGFGVVARLLGLRDHTSVIHGVNAVDRRIALDPDERGDIEGILEQLGVEIEIGPRKMRLSDEEIARRSDRGRLSALAKARRKRDGLEHSLRMAD